MIGDPLPDTDHVSRYCRPSMIEDGLPTVLAFRLRPEEEYLSVHWLELFAAASRAAAVEQVRAVMTETGFSLGRHGRFAVLHVGRARATIRERIGLELRFVHVPADDDPAHAGIFWSHDDEVAIAVALTELVTPGDIYPGRV